MAKKIKSKNLPAHAAATLFACINSKYVSLVTFKYKPEELVCTIDPNDEKIVYPDGWYFGKGSFRNKHQSDSGFYGEVRMVDEHGKIWNTECKVPSEMEEVTVI